MLNYIKCQLIWFKCIDRKIKLATIKDNSSITQVTQSSNSNCYQLSCRCLRLYTHKYNFYKHREFVE